MYHDEKVIDGVLHFRGTPDGPWHRYTAEQLTELVLKAQGRVNMLTCKLEDAHLGLEMRDKVRDILRLCTDD